MDGLLFKVGIIHGFYCIHDIALNRLDEGQRLRLLGQNP